MTTQIIAGLPTSKDGLNYLVPTKWWTEFYQANKECQTLEAIKVPSLKLSNFVDNFMLEYQSHLIEQLEEKCNYLKFNHVKINREINRTIDWTPINPQLWKFINKKLKEKHGVLTFTSRQQKDDAKKMMQLQIIYCSKTRSEAFVGFMPRHANLISVIREVGYQMGFFEVTKSKISYIEKNPQVCFMFHQLEKYTVQSSPSHLLMVFNMERRQDQQKSTNPTFERLMSHNTLNESNEAVVGDMNTMEDDSGNNLLNEPIHNRTISTGAETPLSFALSDGFDLDKQYRVNELFGAKEPQQILEMRQYANKKIHNLSQLIKIPQGPEQKDMNFLQKLAQELIEGILKKKSCKQKQMQFQ